MNALREIAADRQTAYVHRDPVRPRFTYRWRRRTQRTAVSRYRADRINDSLKDAAPLRDRRRDRRGGYGEAAAKALPHAVQVADRWHLMENASRAFLDAVRKSMRQTPTSLSVASAPSRCTSHYAVPRQVSVNIGIVSASTTRHGRPFRATAVLTGSDAKSSARI